MRAKSPERSAERARWSDFDGKMAKSVVDRAILRPQPRWRRRGAGDLRQTGPHDSPVQKPLVLALARAHQWKEKLEASRFATVGEFADAVRLDRAYVGRVFNLTLLAPDIVTVILDGREPSGLSLEKLLKPMPGEWGEQRKVLEAQQ